MSIQETTSTLSNSTVVSGNGTTAAFGFNSDGQTATFVTSATDSAGHHALTVYANSDGGTNTSALNCVSNNSAASCVQVSGTESGRGTIKIAHTKPSVSDANAAAISVDLQGENTAAQGLFITSTATSGTTGSLIKCRNNNSTNNLFIVNPDGSVFIGNVSPAPGTPSAGAVLYVESGSLKVKGSSGTVTVLGAA